MNGTNDVNIPFCCFTWIICFYFFFEENGKTTLLKNYCSKWYVKTRNYCVIYFVDNDSKLTFAAVSPGSILLVQSQQ